MKYKIKKELIVWFIIGWGVGFLLACLISGVKK